MQPAPAPPANQTAQQVWAGAVLGWQASTGTLTASFADGRKAEIKLGSDRAMISGEVIARIEKGKKKVIAGVTVEPAGGKAFRIVKVEE